MIRSSDGSLFQRTGPEIENAQLPTTVILTPVHHTSYFQGYLVVRYTN